MSRIIDYGKLMHAAMRRLIQDVLSDVQDHGLPGTHHFFVTFDTTHPDSQLADWLRERYPSEMTVVMQHWYDDLEVGDEGFGITLNFGEAPEHLFIPYDAIQTFVDPSVEFGLRFEQQQDEDDVDPLEKLDTDAPAAQQDATDPETAQDTPREADVVSLDSFRKS